MGARKILLTYLDSFNSTEDKYHKFLFKLKTFSRYFNLQIVSDHHSQIHREGRIFLFEKKGTVCEILSNPPFTEFINYQWERKNRNLII